MIRCLNMQSTVRYNMCNVTWNIAVWKEKLFSSISKVSYVKLVLNILTKNHENMKVTARIFALQYVKCWSECLAGTIGIAFPILDGL
jgi:hypothetical protein